jgi:hypothetical protein
MPGLELLPFRAPPLPHEMLSSWIVRLCLGLGCELQAFTTQILGTTMLLWNTDVDRRLPDHAIASLSRRTGFNSDPIRALTLESYNGIIFDSKAKSGPLRWILSVNSYRWKTRNMGIQYCPNCLAGDRVPYFRKFWRLAFYTFCPHHQVFLRDACPECNSPLFPSRRDFSVDPQHVVPLHCCAVCGLDLRGNPPETDFHQANELHETYREVLLRTEVESFGTDLDMCFFDGLYARARGYIGYRKRNAPLGKHGRATVQNGPVRERYGRILPWLSRL